MPFLTSLFAERRTKVRRSLRSVGFARRAAALLVGGGLLGVAGLDLQAQNMPHEAGLWFAKGGQTLLNTPNDANQGFFQNPLILHCYYSFLSDGVQSLTFFVEHTAESRDREGLWSDVLIGNTTESYPAHIQERVQLTSLGLETTRNLLTLGDLRAGVGLGVSYGLGGTSATVRNEQSGEVREVSSCSPWQGLMLEALVRLRYTVYTSERFEIAVMASGRYWGFPYIGPLTECPGSYNGPAARALNDFGYLAGVAVGF